MNTELRDLALLVRRMRDAQKEYFRERSMEGLTRAKGLERDVDRAVVAILTRLLEPTGADALDPEEDPSP
jgi:hypothetical protein